MPKIDQSRLEYARAVGLLRMKQRMLGQTGDKVVALYTLIDQLPDDVVAKAQEALDFENSKDAKGNAVKPPQGPIDTTSPKKQITVNPRQQTIPVDMTATTADLAPLLSGSATSSFKKVYDALAAFEAEQVDQEKRQNLLQTFERRAERWLNEHEKDADPVATQRRQKLKELCEQASFEQARFSKGEAQKRYMANVAQRNVFTRNTPPPTAKQEADPDVKFRFRGLTTESSKNVKDNVVVPGGPFQVVRKKQGDKWVTEKNKIPNSEGLTIGEIAAIQIFTGPDYGTINPATATSKARLDYNRARDIGGAFEMQRSDEEYLSEGVVHVGMAMSGLRKLPAYQGQIYRGLSTTQDQFTDWQTNGYVQVSLGSASTDRPTAEGFAVFEMSNERPIGVILVLNNAEARDISHISTKPNEYEVTILAGTKFNFTSTTQLPPTAKGPMWEIVLTKA